MTALKAKSAKLTSANLAIGVAVCVALLASVVGLSVDLGAQGSDAMGSGWHLRGSLPATDVPRLRVPKAVEILPETHLA